MEQMIGALIGVIVVVAYWFIDFSIQKAKREEQRHQTEVWHMRNLARQMELDRAEKEGY